MPGVKITVIFQIMQWEGCTLSWNCRFRPQQCSQDQDSKDKTCNTTDAVTKGGRIPPLLLSSHLGNMIVISKLTITRMKQKAHITIPHNPTGIFPVRINGKSINKKLSMLHSCLMHCRGKVEYTWSVFPFLTFFFTASSSLRHLHTFDRCTRADGFKMWKYKRMVHNISAILSQCKILLNISQINSFVEKWMQDWLPMASASQRTVPSTRTDCKLQVITPSFQEIEKRVI